MSVGVSSQVDVLRVVVGLVQEPKGGSPQAEVHGVVGVLVLALVLSHAPTSIDLFLVSTSEKALLVDAAPLVFQSFVS